MLQDFLHLLEARILRWPAMAGMLRPLVATLAETAVRVLLGAVSLAATRLGCFRVQSSDLKKPIGQRSAAPCMYRTEAGPLNAAANRQLRVSPPPA